MAWINYLLHKHRNSFARLFCPSTHLLSLENFPMERAGWAWVCVYLLQRHCMAFLINGKQVCKITTELVPKILLLARAASQHRTRDSQFFWTKSILFFYKAMIMKGGRSLRPTQQRVQKRKGGSLERLTEKTVSARKSLKQRVVNTSHGEALAEAKEASCWSRLALVSKSGDLGPHCGGKCFLGEFSHSSQKISAAPAIPCLSRNTKACERQLCLR